MGNAKVSPFVGGLISGHTFALGKKSPWRVQYVGPLPGIQVNTVEGLVLNGVGLKLKYKQGKQEKDKKVLNINPDGIQTYILR
jgi:hypothetical protein